MTSLAEYKNKYEFIEFDRRDGILEMRLHHEGAPFVLTEAAHHGLGFAFADIGDDAENRVIILTGTGDRYCTEFDYGSFITIMDPNPHEYWVKIRNDGNRLVNAFLDIPVPVISAINGPVYSHSELPVLADIVLAADTTVFRDGTHIIDGLPPGDGMQTVWTTLLGMNRGRYFLLTGQRLTAQEAFQHGAVAEVLPPAELNARAWELAADLSRWSRVALSNIRSTLTHEWKRLMLQQLHAGITYETVAAISFPPFVTPDPPIVDLSKL
jgi:enoyl-CoA hydratase/carnithine racemase